VADISLRRQSQRRVEQVPKAPAPSARAHLTSVRDRGP